jgi:hypothetical protein
MKTLFTTLFLLTFLFANTTQAQWVPTGLSNGTVNIVFANGGNLFAGLSNGVLISTDNGASWNYTSLSSSLSAWSFGVYGTNIFVGTTGGLFRSADNGSTWNIVNISTGWVQSFAVIGNNFFVGTEGGGVFLSTDGGTSWTPVNTGLTNLTVRALIAKGTTLYAGTNGSGIFFSTDNGSSWNTANTGLTGLDVRGFAVVGTNLFAGTDGGVFRSINNGANWTNVLGGLVRGMAVACGSDLYVGGWYNGGYVARTSDNGTNWTSLSAGLTTSTVPTLFVSGSNLFAGTWNGGVFRLPITCSAPDSTGSICGMKFNDLNGNGIQDPGEPGLPGWIINLTYNYITGPVHLTDTTDANGNYCFNNLQPGGTYTVFETNQSGWQQTLPVSPGTYTIPLTSGEHKDSINFGNKQLPQLGSICGMKFNDLNGNGVQDPGEPGLPGWIINLTYNYVTGPVHLTDTTDANGDYCFNNLQPGGTYTVFETNQSGWQQTLPVSPGTYTIPLTSGQHVNTVNFGNHLLAKSLCDSLKANASKITPGDCNWSLSLNQPANLTGIGSIQIVCLSPNQFTTGTGLGPNFQNWFTSGLNTFTPPNGHVPGGNLNNFFNMSLSYVTSPQIIVVNWLDSLSNKICSDTLKLNCQISCISIIRDTVTCVGNKYNLSYLFTNNATFGMSNIVYTLLSPNTVTISPLTAILLPNVSSGSNSGPQNILISGALPGDTVRILGRFNSPDSCCWCYDSLIVIIPTCASVCDSISVQAQGSSTDCCYSISLTNNSSMVFSNVEFELLSGGMYSTVATTSSPGWGFTNITPNNLINLVKFPIAQGIGHGTFSNVLDMCIRQYSSPNQIIVVNWIKDGKVICRDTLRFQCVPTVIKTDSCSQVINGILKCLPNGTFQYNFRVQNNSTINSTGYGIYPTTPGVSFSQTIFPNISIMPNQVSPMDSIIISGIGGNENVCFQTAIFTVVTGVNAYNFCCHSDTMCMTTPVCDGKVGCIQPPDSMVGWWTGDGNTNDISGNNNNGTLHDGVGYVSGKVAQAFNLTTNGYISVPNNSTLNFGIGNFSIDAWVKTTDTVNSFTIAEKTFLGTNYALGGYGFLITQGKLRFLLGDGTTMIDNTETTVHIADGKWHFVAVTIDRKNANVGKLYVDGNLVLTFNTTTILNSISCTSQLNIFDISYYFNHSGNHIDELEMFNRVLLNTEISSIFAADSSGKCKPVIPDSCNTKVWSPLGTGINNGTNGEVWALAAIGSDLYVGGNFTTAGGVTVNHIAKWNGSNWSALASNGVTGINGIVFALAVSGTNLYASGWFTSAGGIPTENIAKWDGTNWSALGNGLQGYGSVEALAVMGNNLYAGGAFTIASGGPGDLIAQWDMTASVWSSLGNNGGMNDRVNSLTTNGTDLYAGGQFTFAGVIPANHIAKWDGTNWSALGSGTDLRIGGSLVMMAGNLYVGGVFTTAGGVSANDIAKWDGTNWSPLGSGMANGVEGLGVMGTNLYASGNFQTAGGVSANNIAKWDGTNWSPLGSGMDNGVWRLAVIGQDLYAGGAFITAGGVNANYIAKYSCGIPTSVNEGKNGNTLPKQFQLEQNYPNPFNPSSTIRYDIPKSSFVKISVYDILGREIRVLVNQVKSPGRYEITFNANGLASGVYFYKIRTEEFTQIKKMILMK